MEDPKQKLKSWDLGGTQGLSTSAFHEPTPSAIWTSILLHPLPDRAHIYPSHICWSTRGKHRCRLCSLLFFGLVTYLPQVPPWTSQVACPCRPSPNLAHHNTRQGGFHKQWGRMEVLSTRLCHVSSRRAQQPVGGGPGQSLWPYSSPSYPTKEVSFLSDSVFQCCRALARFNSFATSGAAGGGGGGGVCSVFPDRLY